MLDATIRTTDDRGTTLASADLTALDAAMRGELLTRASPDYDDARRLWNGMIDRHPALIARCRGAADVQHVVRFAARHALRVGVRGGGHNIAGSAMVDDGLVLDLSGMRSVEMDADRRTARVEPGATLGDLDRVTQAKGLAVPVGINSTTGIAGLTLGGGYGWLSRKHGLTVDSLRSVNIVTADGELRTASAEEHPDLFWAVRGGGGNFGIVTSFEFALHPVGPEVLAGFIVHPLADGEGVLRAYRGVMRDAPDALSAWLILRNAPPLPFLPESVHGQGVVVIAVMYAGDEAAGARALAPLRAIGTPHADAVGPASYAEFQTVFDPLLTPGARNYWKTHNFADLHDGLIDVLVARARDLPGPQTEIFVPHLGGAVGRVAEDATAFAGRDARFLMNVHARWDDASDDAAHIAWAREVHTATAPFASAAAYVNFLSHDDGDRVRMAYGANYDRLAAIKAEHDPANMFRANQNVVPLAGR